MLAGGQLVGSHLLGPSGTAPTSITLYIGGIDRSRYYADGSLLIEDPLDGRSTCSFVLRDHTNVVSIDTCDDVHVYDADGALVFAGTVDATRETWPAMDATTTYHEIAVDVVDYNQIADRHLVAASYSTAGQLPGEVAELIRSGYLAQDSVTAGRIDDGDFSIGTVNYSYDKASRALDDLAELVGFAWRINSRRRLDFYDRAAFPAPWGLTASALDVLYLEKETIRTNYRNQQTLRAGKEITDSSRVVQFDGDGDTISFHVALPIAEAPTVEVDTGGGYVTKTVGINEVDSGKDWYWNKGSTAIEQDSGGTVLDSGDTLQVTYKALLDIIVQQTDEAEVTAMVAAEGGSGLYEGVDTDRRIEDADFATERAAGILQRLARIPVRVRFGTDEPGLLAGHLFSIELTREGLTGDYLIENVSAVDRGDGKLRYDVECIDGEPLGGWVTFFKRLARQGADFVIRENEILLILRKQTSNVDLTDTLTSTQADDLSSYLLDPYTVFHVGTAVIGYGYTDAGTDYNAGSRIGTMTNLQAKTLAEAKTVVWSALGCTASV